ncbi:glycosyltransferase [Microbacterium aquimaris]|uniref:Glycosyltransferase n=1 Tax=Microbacterium aquimaris TaxID=459816 RepID=A0ABU5N963_9MICO|nr:glycosyltransferase [Microbacterium aquimaris]MDZ8162613.1 glycosyltransferase [Microbacterium aquimaris]
MKVLLITAGSRGDVEPFLALARRLATEGHQAHVALPDNSGADTEGVVTISLGADFTRVIEQQGVSPVTAMRSLRTVVRPIMRAVFLGAVRAARETSPDVILYHPKVLSAPLAADVLGVPHIVAELVPAMTPTRAFPAAGTVPFSLGPLNRVTYAGATGARRMFAADLDAASRELGRPERPRQDSPASSNLVPVSPAVLERPDDWPVTTTLTGAWTGGGHAQDRPVDAELAQFLDGEVLYAGFGSMAASGATRRGRAVVEAARSQGLRALVVTGLGGLGVDEDLRGDDVLVREAVDHHAVLPRVVAAVHHGGVGTVHAALGAAAPSVIVPFIADQPFWGARLAAAGLGPSPIRASRLDIARLSRAIERIDRYRPATTEAAERMRAEDGTGTATRILERISDARR